MYSLNELYLYTTTTPPENESNQSSINEIQKNILEYFIMKTDGFTMNRWVIRIYIDK